MSSSMETACLLSDVQEQAHKTWREIDLQKWQEKAGGCPGREMPISTSFCILTTKPCDYKTCFGRYWGGA